VDFLDRMFTFDIASLIIPVGETISFLCNGRVADRLVAKIINPFHEMWSADDEDELDLEINSTYLRDAAGVPTSNPRATMDPMTETLTFLTQD
jgi:hypothetical protein